MLKGWILMSNTKNKKIYYLGKGSLLAIVLMISLLFLTACGKEKHTVTFNVDNKLYKETIKVDDGKNVKFPENPQKEGYTFAGWYLNDEKFDTSTPVEGDINLEARFTINTYTVTFNFDNDDEDLIEKVNFNEKVTRPRNPQKEGKRRRHLQ